MSYNKKAHLGSNTEAIRIAFALDRERCRATGVEHEVLQQYSGFGGIKCILNPVEKETDKNYWTKTDLELFPLVSNLHKLIRIHSKDEQEYRRYFNSLKSSVLTAFYTPPEAIKALSNALKENGIMPSNFLEPSAGCGAFVETFKDTFPETKTTAFEKDLLTGKILSHLHPNDRVHVRGFEEIEIRPDNRFDIVASNIPFGDTAVFDMLFSKSNDSAKRQSTHKVHNYFFLKGVETLRQGGILAFITSQGVMNSPQNEPVRQWLMNKTNLVSAIRLPNNLMSDNAGTEVGSDLIILQKNSYKTSLTTGEQAFIKCRTLSNGITINNYFQDFRRVVHTKTFVDKDLYGKPGMIYLHEGGVQGMAADLKGMLSGDFATNLNKELYAGNSITMPKSPHPMPFVEQQPVMLLYDLFNFSEEERKQVHTKKRERKSPVSVHGKPVQLNLFSQPQIQSKTIKHNTITHNSRINLVYPVFDARKEEAERQQRELEKPRPWSGVLQKHHKQGSLVIAQNGQI
jgi:hypothetical protein